MVQSVQMFAIIQIPQHRFAIFTTAGAQTAVWGNGNGVQIAGVTSVIDL